MYCDISRKKKNCFYGSSVSFEPQTNGENESVLVAYYTSSNVDKMLACELYSASLSSSSHQYTATIGNYSLMVLRKHLN